MFIRSVKEHVVKDQLGENVSESEGNGENEDSGVNLNKNVPEVFVCGAELHALRLLFLLLSINTISKNSGQYLASDAIQIADFPIIG